VSYTTQISNIDNRTNRPKWFVGDGAEPVAGMAGERCSKLATDGAGRAGAGGSVGAVRGKGGWVCEMGIECSEFFALRGENVNLIVTS
jgi:hypothetical protein